MLKQVSGTEVEPSGELNTWAVALAEMARQFDHLAEDVIDANMCTAHCPCLKTTGKNDSPAFVAYRSVNEAYMNRRGRTWNKDTKGDSNFTPFTWTVDENIGFITFESCLEKWFGNGKSEQEL